MLLHFGFVTFPFHYRKTRQPLMFMILGFSDVSMIPKTNIIHFSRHQDTPNNSRRNPTSFSNMIVSEISLLGKSKCLKHSKRRALDNPDDPSNQFLKVLDMGPISSRKHEMMILSDPGIRMFYHRIAVF